jgi:hypothetical protein
MAIPRPVSAQDITPTPDGSTPAAATELPVAITPAAGGISSPENDATLSGAVEIKGTALSGWNLSFSYADNSSGTWFTLAQSPDPFSDAILATWDTTTISDGAYVLWLHVSAADGVQDFKINVRVRNYSQLETPTSVATPTLPPTSTPISTLASGADATFTATVIVTDTPVSSPTISAPLPPNPATLDPRDIAVTFGKGVLGVVILFVTSGLLLFLGRKLHS